MAHVAFQSDSGDKISASTQSLLARAGNSQLAPGFSSPYLPPTPVSTRGSFSESVTLNEDLSCDTRIYALAVPCAAFVSSSSSSSSYSYSFTSSSSSSDVVMAHSSSYLHLSPSVSPASTDAYSSSSSRTPCAFSCLSTSASSFCEVGIDSSSFPPPTPPSSPVSAHSQSMPFHETSLLNRGLAASASCKSSTAASNPASPSSSCHRFTPGYSPLQLHAHRDKKDFFQPMESLSKVHQFGSLFTTSPRSSMLQSYSGEDLESVAAASTQNYKALIYASPRILSFHPKPATICHSSALWPQLQENDSSASALSYTFPAADVPFLAGVGDGSAPERPRPVPASEAPHLPPRLLGSPRWPSRNLSSAGFFSPSLCATRRREVLRSPSICFVGLLLLFAACVAFLGVLRGWWTCSSFSVDKLVEYTGKHETHKRGTAYSTIAPTSGVGRLAALSASPTRFRSPAVLSGVASYGAPRATLNRWKHHAEKFLNGTTTTDMDSDRAAHVIDKAGSQHSQSEESVKHGNCLMVAQPSRIQSVPGEFIGAAGYTKAVSGSAMASLADADVCASASNLIKKSWEMLTHVLYLMSMRSAAAKTAEGLPPSYTKAPISQPTPQLHTAKLNAYEEDALFAAVRGVRDKIFLFANKWKTWGPWYYLRSLGLLPSGFLVLLAVSICCCLCCLFLSGSLVYKHLTNYYEPHLQRYICRVCLVGPAFAISSLTYFAYSLPTIAADSSSPMPATHSSASLERDVTLSGKKFFCAATASGVRARVGTGTPLEDPCGPFTSNSFASAARREEIFVEFLRDLAQAVALYSFLVLMTNCCGGDRCISLTVACNPNKVSPVPPLNFIFRPFHPGPQVLRYLRIGVMQCVLMVPLVGVASFLQALSSDAYYYPFQGELSLSGVHRLTPNKAVALADRPYPFLLRPAQGGVEEPLDFPSRKGVTGDRKFSSREYNARISDDRSANTSKSPDTSLGDSPIFDSPDAIGNEPLPSWLIGFSSVISWRSLLLLISVTICMFSLLQFYICTESLLRPYKPLQKFLSIKFLVFFQVWQKLAIYVLLRLNVIQVNDVFDPSDMADLYHNVMMGAWTVAVSISHIICFPVKDHVPEVPPDGRTPAPPGATLLQSLLDVFLAVDVLYDAREITLVQHRSLDRACSLLLDQSVEAGRDGLLIGSTPETPGSVLSLTKPLTLKRLLNTSESAEENIALPRSCPATPKAFNGRASMAPAHACSMCNDEQAPCGSLQNCQQSLAAEGELYRYIVPTSKHSGNSSPHRKRIKKASLLTREGGSPPQQISKHEQQLLTLAHTDTRADLSAAPESSCFPVQDNNSTVVKKRGIEGRESGEKAMRIKLVVTTSSSEAPAQSSLTKTRPASSCADSTQNLPQQPQLQPTSHTLVASMGSPLLLLPPTWSFADTPLHSKNITPYSDSQTLRSSGGHLGGVGENTTVHILSGSPPRVAQRGAARQLPPSATAAAAAAAVAAATNRTPLSATAKAAAAARYQFTAGAGSPFHDCPAAALAAALGDFDTAGAFASVAATIAAREEGGDNRREGEEGGMEQSKTEASLRGVPSCTFLDRLTCSYSTGSSNNSSSTTSFSINSSRSVGASRSIGSADRRIAGDSSFLDQANVILEDTQISTSEGDCSFEKSRRASSCSPRTRETLRHRRVSNGSVKKSSCSDTIASSPVGQHKAEKQEEENHLQSPTSESVISHQGSDNREIYVQAPQQIGLGRRISSLLNWATQNWAYRITAIGNAPEAMAAFGRNLLTRRSPRVCVPDMLHASGFRRVTSVLRDIHLEKEAYNVDADPAILWGAKDSESHDLLVQALTRQQQMWASPANRRRQVSSSSERSQEEHCDRLPATARANTGCRRLGYALPSQHCLDERQFQAPGRERQNPHRGTTYEREQQQFVVTSERNRLVQLPKNSIRFPSSLQLEVTGEWTLREDKACRDPVQRRGESSIGKVLLNHTKHEVDATPRQPRIISLHTKEELGRCGSQHLQQQQQTGNSRGQRWKVLEILEEVCPRVRSIKPASDETAGEGDQEQHDKPLPHDNPAKCGVEITHETPAADPFHRGTRIDSVKSDASTLRSMGATHVYAPLAATHRNEHALSERKMTEQPGETRGEMLFSDRRSSAVPTDKGQCPALQAVIGNVTGTAKKTVFPTTRRTGKARKRPGCRHSDQSRRHDTGRVVVREASRVFFLEDRKFVRTSDTQAAATVVQERGCAP